MAIDEKVQSEKSKPNRRFHAILAMAGSLIAGIPLAIMLHERGNDIILDYKARKACTFLYNEAIKGTVSGTFQSYPLGYVVDINKDGELDIILHVKSGDMVYEDKNHDGRPERFFILTKKVSLELELDKESVTNYKNSIIIIAEKTAIEKMLKDNQPKYEA